MIKNRHTGIELFSSDLMYKNSVKKVYLKDWFTQHQVCRTQIFYETQKIRPDFFLFWPSL